MDDGDRINTFDSTNPLSEYEDKVYILLPVFNRKKLTQRFIKCLLSQTFQNYHLILIDDGSSDGTDEMVQSHINALTIIKGTGNWWWAGSLQKGYEWLCQQPILPSDIVLIINDDTHFNPDFLGVGVRVLQESQNSILLAYSYGSTSQNLLDRGVSINWKKFTFEQAENPKLINCFSTNGLMMKYSEFVMTSGFRPKFLPHYASDYEYTIRAIRQGLKPIVSPEFKLWRNEETTGYHSIDINEYKSTSFLEFLQKYFSLKSPDNPIFLTSFIFLSCPMRWKFQNLIRVWKRSLSLLLRKIKM